MHVFCIGIKIFEIQRLDSILFSQRLITIFFQFRKQNENRVSPLDESLSHYCAKDKNIISILYT